MISVIIPVYNAEPYLCRCIDSVLHSDCEDFEILLINDGSTDGSLQICSRYAGRDSRIRLISQENQGVSAARNKGISEARGEWLIFLDADDFISHDFLSMTAQPQYRNRDLILFCFAVYRTSESSACEDKCTSENGAAGTFTFENNEMQELIRRILAPRPLTKTGTPDFRTPCARAYRKDLLDRYSIRFSPDIKIGEDLLFNLEYQLKAKSCTFIPKTVYYYDVHEDSSSHHFNPKLRENHALLLQTVKEVLQKSGLFSPLEQEYYSYALENLTYVLIREIFSPLSPRSYRENRKLCREMRRNPLYREALKYNGRTGILPRKILVFFFRLPCFPLVSLISGISYVWLAKK